MCHVWHRVQLTTKKGFRVFGALTSSSLKCGCNAWEPLPAGASGKRRCELNILEDCDETVRRTSTEFLAVPQVHFLVCWWGIFTFVLSICLFCPRIRCLKWDRVHLLCWGTWQRPVSLMWNHVLVIMSLSVSQTHSQTHIHTCIIFLSSSILVCLKQWWHFSCLRVCVCVLQLNSCQSLGQIWTQSSSLSATMPPGPLERSACRWVSHSKPIYVWYCAVKCVDVRPSLILFSVRSGDAAVHCYGSEPADWDY